MLVRIAARNALRTVAVPTVRTPLRTLTISARNLADKDPKAPYMRPGPMSLPKEDQAEFERLVKENQNKLQFTSAANELHPDARKPVQPDFTGDVNPTTGEIGGPKKDPLAWDREWTYGGRSTDF